MPSRGSEDSNPVGALILASLFLLFMVFHENWEYLVFYLPHRASYVKIDAVVKTVSYGGTARSSTKYGYVYFTLPDDEEGIVCKAYMSLGWMENVGTKIKIGYSAEGRPRVVRASLRNKGKCFLLAIVSISPWVVIYLKKREEQEKLESNMPDLSKKIY